MLRKLPDRNELTDKERHFVSEFTTDWNAARAALAVGYTKASVHAGTTNILARHRVQKAIAEAMRPTRNRNRRSADWVLEGIEHIADITSNEEGAYFNARNALRAFELLGKHHRLFTEQVEIHVRTDLGDRIMEGKQRARITATETRHIDGETGNQTITRVIEAESPEALREVLALEVMQ